MGKISLNKRAGILSISLLILLLPVFVLALSGCSSKVASNRPTINKVVNAAEANTLMTQNQGLKDFVILDVRTAEEFASGHLANAINIDIYKADFKTKISELDRNYKYLVYCRTGSRSAQAAGVMNDLGFKEIYDLGGGITRWIQENNPVVK
jgi:rhodanese-related sulfurtransferase